MAIVLKDLFERYCLSEEEVKPLLYKKYHIKEINSDLVLEDEQANFLIDTIYGKIDNDVDIHYELISENDFDWDDDEDFFNLEDDEEEDIPDCPPRSQLSYTCGSLACPCCGQIGDTYTDGTAYCSKCRKWYRYS